MTKYNRFDFSKIRGYSLYDRHSKVTVEDFAAVPPTDSVPDLLDSLPDILAVKEVRKLVSKLDNARRQGKPIIWGFGGHVIKTGLAPILIDLMNRGFVSALATNGSGVIHDFEVAISGKTSEDVEAQLGTGLFGMAEETGLYMNRAIQKGLEQDLGIGESLGAYLDESQAKFAQYSLILQAFRKKLPLTVHIAVGTDIIHMHPTASGKALGEGSMVDFRIFTQMVSHLDKGGVYINLGSAVILPEVFLKAVSVVRGSGKSLENFTTANLDFIQHYRPLQNVVKRPVRESGTGIAITGHHEIMVPFLAACLRGKSKSDHKN